MRVMISCRLTLEICVNTGNATLLHLLQLKNRKMGRLLCSYLFNRIKLILCRMLYLVSYKPDISFLERKLANVFTRKKLQRPHPNFIHSCFYEMLICYIIPDHGIIWLLTGESWGNLKYLSVVSWTKFCLSPMLRFCKSLLRSTRPFSCAWSYSTKNS